MEFLLFLILFVSLCMIYEVDHKMLLRPQSLHIWRQADGLSITQNYYQRNNPLLEPEIYNMLADNSSSGRSAGEFPGLYYFVASLWKVTGKSEALFRLIVLLFTFAGLYLLFRTARGFLKDTWQALFISLMPLTSVIFVSYSFNFLPNMPAFSLVLGGWYFTWKFHLTRRNAWLWAAMASFSLGMLLKISSGISFFALFGWLAIEFCRKKDDRTLFRRPALQSLPFLAALLPVLAWYLYAGWYNDIHKAHYTFNDIWPVWSASDFQVAQVVRSFLETWMHEFFHVSVWLATAAMWVFLMITHKKRSLILNYLVLVIPLGCVVYLLLWFQAFDRHDYYYIEFYIPFILTWILFFKTLNSWKRSRQWFVYLVLAGWFIFNISDFASRFRFRYTNWMNSWYLEKMEAVGGLEPLLRAHGVLPDDLVISIPDGSINVSLYLMNQRGFTNYGSDFTRIEGFEERIADGAVYLVINDTAVLKQEEVRHFAQHLILNYKNVNVYDLKPFKE